MTQDNDERYNNNNDGNSNTNEDPDKPPGKTLESAAARGEFVGVPAPVNPVELPGVAPPENSVELSGVVLPEKKLDDDAVPPLLSSDYGKND